MSCVFVLTVRRLICFIFNCSTFTDIVMNIIGIFMWLAVGATALHYWHGYQSEHKYIHVSSERQVRRKLQ